MFLVLCAVFLVDVCILVSLAVVVFLPNTDSTFLFALHLERFYFDNRAIFCLGDAWEDSFVTTSCCVCGPCHFPIFSVLLGGCIFPRFGPWLNRCAAGSPFGSRMVTTSRSLICDLFKLGKFGWWMSRPTGALARRCCVSLHFTPFFLLAFLVTFFQFFSLPQKMNQRKKYEKKQKQNKNKSTISKK